MATTKIEWTRTDDGVSGMSWNPVRGCTKISPGCTHCYAETFAERFRGVPGHPYEQGFDLRLVPDKLDEPKRWKKPRRVFVNSMSDLFHKDVPDDYVVDVCRTMAAADRHTYHVLTKRSERLRDLLATRLRPFADLPHVWWGVSVEDRRYGLPRVEHLRAAPALNRWLSVEPLLEDLGPFDLTGIGWVVVGGESGHGARLLDLDWVRSLRDRCRAAGVAFFFKQMLEKRRKVSLPLLDGRPWAELPATPHPNPPPQGGRGQEGPAGFVPSPLAGEG